MGCRPSRHSSGRVADSSWGYDKNGYFRNDSKKKKRGKHECLSEKKPAEFSTFSSTSKTYQKTNRNGSQCSKITLRLSTDGSMLEIEKYDIDFHTDKEVQCIKDTDWSSQGNSMGQINGIVNSKNRFTRCLSAPQLKFLPAISENLDDSECRLRVFSNGFTDNRGQSKSQIAKMKHSKTFANGSVIGEARAVLDSCPEDKEDKDPGSRLNDTVMVDFESESRENKRLLDNQIGIRKHTTNEKRENECALLSRNNSKSICDKAGLIENSTQNDYVGGESNFKSSSQLSNEDCIKRAASDDGILSSGSNRKDSCFTNSKQEPSVSVLRTEVNHSINRFNEILLCRQQRCEDLDTYETEVSIHAHLETACKSTCASIQTSSFVENNTTAQVEVVDNVQNSLNMCTENKIHVTSCMDDNSIKNSLDNYEIENNVQSITELNNLNGTTDRTSPGCKHSYSSHRTRPCSYCITSAHFSSSNVVNDTTICQCLPCCAKTEGALNNSKVCQMDREGITLSGRHICHGQKETFLRDNALAGGIMKTNCDTLPGQYSCFECDKHSIAQRRVIVGLSKTEVQVLGVRDTDVSQLTIVGTDRQVDLYSGVSTDNPDLKATAVDVTTQRLTDNIIRGHTNEDVMNNNKDQMVDLDLSKADHDGDLLFYEGQDTTSDVADDDNDDDDDEFFDENYDDYDEAEEYYDARHSLYV